MGISSSKESTGPLGTVVLVDKEELKNVPSQCSKHSSNVGVSGCPINPDNQMPLEPCQKPSEGQPFSLNTDRQTSTIPKFDNRQDKFWVYPSEQMFWNAMIRKGWKWQEAVDGKDDGKKFTSKDMSDIIRIHNANNELAWREVLKWELSFHLNDCPLGPTLKRFGGRAQDISPRARFRHLVLRSNLPFDRHDWVIDRCGKDVRYIIDYYDAESEKFSLDVRPAFDSFEAVWDRMRAFYYRWASDFIDFKPKLSQEK